MNQLKYLAELDNFIKFILCGTSIGYLVFFFNNYKLIKTSRTKWNLNRVCGMIIINNDCADIALEYY